MAVSTAEGVDAGVEEAVTMGRSKSCCCCCWFLTTTLRFRSGDGVLLVGDVESAGLRSTQFKSFMRSSMPDASTNCGPLMTRLPSAGRTSTGRRRLRERRLSMRFSSDLAPWRNRSLELRRKLPNMTGSVDVPFVLSSASISVRLPSGLSSAAAAAAAAADRAATAANPVGSSGRSTILDQRREWRWNVH